MDLDSSAHMLAAGVNGSRKRNFIKHYLCNALDQGHCKIFLVDLSYDLFGYSSNKNLLYTTGTSRARQFVDQATEELHARAKIFREIKGVQKIGDWQGADSPERILLGFEEFEDFSNDNEFVKKIVFLARKGRHYGIHALLATQGSRADVFKSKEKDKSILDNINTRIAFRASSQAHASALGEPMASPYQRRTKRTGCHRWRFRRNAQV